MVRIKFEFKTSEVTSQSTINCTTGDIKRKSYCMDVNSRQKMNRGHVVKKPLKFIKLLARWKFCFYIIFGCLIPPH